MIFTYRSNRFRLNTKEEEFMLMHGGVMAVASYEVTEVRTAAPPHDWQKLQQEHGFQIALTANIYR